MYFQNVFLCLKVKLLENENPAFVRRADARLFLSILAAGAVQGFRPRRNIARAERSVYPRRLIMSFVKAKEYLDTRGSGGPDLRSGITNKEGCCL